MKGQLNGKKETNQKCSQVSSKDFPELYNLGRVVVSFRIPIQ